MSPRRPSRATALALVGVVVGILGASLFAYSLTPPAEVCNSGMVTLEIPRGSYDTTAICGPVFVTPQYTYGLMASANASVDFYLIQDRQLFLDSMAGYTCCNVSDAQAFITTHSQNVGLQIQLAPSPVNLDFTPRTNSSTILVLLNATPTAANFSLTSAVFLQTVPVGVYFFAGLLVVPAGIILTLPYLFGRRRRDWAISQEQIGPEN